MWKDGKKMKTNKNWKIRFKQSFGEERFWQGSWMNETEARERFAEMQKSCSVVDLLCKEDGSAIVMESYRKAV